MSCEGIVRLARQPRRRRPPRARPAEVEQVPARRGVGPRAGLRFGNPARFFLIPFDCVPVLADACLRGKEAALRKAGPRRLVTVTGLALALFATPAKLRAQSIPGAIPESAKALSQGEWPAYAGTYASARYSPLTQIDRSNAKNLHIVWRWKSPDVAIHESNPAIGPSFANESTPLMIGGALYTSTSLSQVAAIDAATGVTRWVFDPKIYENGLGMPPNLGWLNRGVAYWRNGDDERIVILTAFAQMIALNAKTGEAVPGFGTDGRVDLTQGLRRPVDRGYYTMTSPPVIVRGVIVVGSSVFDWLGHTTTATWRRARFRCRHGTFALDLPHGCASGRTRCRNLEKDFLEGGRQRQRLGADERRRGTRLRLSAGEHADQRLLRRPSPRRRALRRAAWSASTPRPAGRSGTTSSFITVCGITIHQPRRI